MALTKAELEELELLELEQQEAEFLAQNSKKELDQENTFTDTVRKIAQGGAAGFSDELAGGLEAGGRMLGVKGAGGPIRDISLQEPSFDLQGAYIEGRDLEREKLKQAEMSSPIVGSVAEFVGAGISPVNKIGKGLSLAKQAALSSGIYGLGSSEEETVVGDLAKAGENATVGLVNGKAFSKILPKKGLASKAEQLAENATGATAAQSQKYADNAGRELLDRGIVAFGDTPEKIAEKSGLLIKQAERTIDSTLKALDKQGVTVSVDNIVTNLEQKAAQLASDPSQAPVVRKLKTLINDIIETGNSKIKPSDAEITKRGYNKIARNWLDPEQGQAGKIAYLAYRDAVEQSAQIVDPSLAKEFIGAKKVYALMNPIVDAAERRAAQLNQQPMGGLLDVASAGAGGAVAGPIGVIAGVGTAAARRSIAPRLSSSMAVIVDEAAKKLPTLNYLTLSNPSAIDAFVEKLTGLNYIPSPYEVEQFLRKDRNLKPSEKAKLLKENNNR
jgi:hypothetical protein